MKRVTLALALQACVTLSAQGVVSIDDLLKPTSSSWPMYNGDYSGRRFSSLSTIDQAGRWQAEVGWTIDQGGRCQPKVWWTASTLLPSGSRTKAPK